MIKFNENKTKYFMKSTIYIVILLGLLTSITSCNDNKDEFLEDYDTIFYFLNSGEQNITIYKTGEDANHTVTINKAGSNLQSEGTVYVSVLSNDEINAYNQENGTSYTMLPETSYKLLTQRAVEFNKNDLYKFFEILFKTDVIDNLDSNKDYVLPLILNSNDSVNSKKQIILVNPTVEIPSVYFTKTGYILNSLSDKSQEQVELLLPLTISATNKWEFNCTVEVDETLIDTYNQENGVNYLSLPSEAFSLNENGIVEFNSTDQIANLKIQVDRTKLSYGNYILPLRLTSCSKESFAIDQESNTCLFGISYTPDISDLKVIELSESMLSSNAVEPTEGSLANLLDGNTDTYFHSAWSISVTDAHYLQVELDEATSAFTFNFIGRKSGGSGNPKNIDIYSSVDGINFEKVISIMQEDLPTGAEASYASPVIVMPESKYIRFTVPQNMSGGSFFVFSEFSMKGL